MVVPPPLKKRTGWWKGPWKKGLLPSSSSGPFRVEAAAAFSRPTENGDNPSSPCSIPFVRLSCGGKAVFVIRDSPLTKSVSSSSSAVTVWYGGALNSHSVAASTQGRANVRERETTVGEKKSKEKKRKYLCKSGRRGLLLIFSFASILNGLLAKQEVKAECDRERQRQRERVTVADHLTTRGGRRRRATTISARRGGKEKRGGGGSEKNLERRTEIENKDDCCFVPPLLA